jgi:hypothetical protein
MEGIVAKEVARELGASAGVEHNRRGRASYRVKLLV